MSESQTPIVILVHGAWHGAWCFAALQAELDARGIASLAVDLPGHGTSLEPFTDLLGDAAHVTRVVAAIEHPVVLVGHSYGGSVITQAAAAATNVRHLVYLSAFVPDVGESTVGLMQTMPPAQVELSNAMVIGSDGFSTIDPERAQAAFYGMCKPAVTPANVARLCPQPFVTFTQPVTAAAWTTLPSTYVRCTQDQAVHITHQDYMSLRCTHVVTIATDHSPFASMPTETADILEHICLA